MANNQINKLLEFANMQMAAEAFLLRQGEASMAAVLPQDIVDRLKEGNTHASKFTPIQATQFTAQYEVLAQYRNDPLQLNGTGMGFSATLFKNRQTGELTLSFRSTEFIDDAVRDSKSTNELEIKELGWAFGQIAEMEAWYKNVLSTNTSLLGNGAGGAKNFNVTGYSLGGHLATAFNILRREEYALSPALNPITATYTFNGAGTGGLLNNRRLTDLLTDFNRIRANYETSPEWLAMTVGDQNTLRDLAQSRVNKIVAEQTRVNGLSGVTRALAATNTPFGGQYSLAYQIAALIVGRDTLGSSNFPLPGGTNWIPTNPVFATDYRFANMTEVVGMEVTGLAPSFVSNSGTHYGYRQEIYIEDQPLTRGNYFLPTALGDLVSNPGTNDFADTHSLVLLVDSLTLMAAMEKLAPSLTIETARQIYAAMSNAGAVTQFGSQGKAEGDTLEKMLDALRTIVFGPGQTPTLTEDNMRKVLEGNTWANTEFREPFQSNVKALQEQSVALVALGAPFQFDSLVTIPAESLKNLALNAEILAYRYALKELNPFALVGVNANGAVYSWHNLKGELDLYNAAARTGALTTEWITDRSVFLAWKNIANTQNTPTNTSAMTLLQSNLTTVSQRFIDLPQKLDLGVVPLGGGMPALADARRFVFGGDGVDRLDGGAEADNLYGGGGTDVLQGKGGNDYLEGGAGLDIYRYNGYAATILNLSGSHDGADIIRDIDGKGVLRYVFNDNPAPISTVIAEASNKISDTEWRSADGKFTYTKSGSDLVITINDFNDASITLRDFRDGDFNIYLRDARPTPTTTVTINGDRERVEYTQTVPVGYVAEPLWRNITVIATQTDAGGQPVSYTITYNKATNPYGNLETTATEIVSIDALYGGAAGGVTEAGEELIGGGHNDTLLADRPFGAADSGAGNRDIVRAGDGRDVIEAGAGADLVEGGADGEYQTEVGGDLIYGGAGDDELYGDTTIPIKDAITQGAGSGAPGGDWSELGVKGDFVSAGAGDDWLVGADKGDFLDGSSGADLIIGGLGNDTIHGDWGLGTGLGVLWHLTRSTTPLGNGLSTYTTTYIEMPQIDSGAAGADVIYAGGGEDWVLAGGADDYVDLGAGNDVGSGMGGADILIGGEGNDVMAGDSFDNYVPAAEHGGDYLDGGAGNDTLYGEGGSDYLMGGADNDVLFGGIGDDILSADAGNDLVFGGDGNDLLEGGTGEDRLYGEAGNDTLIAGAGDDFLYGGDGSDLIYGGAGVDVLEGGAGKDTYVFRRGDGTEHVSDTDAGSNSPDASVLILEGVNRTDIKFRVGSLLVDTGNGDMIHVYGFDQVNPTATTALGEIRLDDGTSMSYADILAQGFDIDGTEGDDNNNVPTDPRNLVGTGVADRMRGLGGNDLIFGLTGDDMLDGGDGIDTLYGGAGSDTLYGGAGGDTLWGAGDNAGVIAPDTADIVYGGAGNDFIKGYEGGDQLWGEADNDTIYGMTGADVIDGGAGNDNLFSDGVYAVQIGVDIIQVQNAFDDGSSDTLRGGDGNDFLEGASGAELLEGGTGIDQLQGYAGNDVLDGGAGVDNLLGGDGADTLTGGADNNDVLQGQAGNDTYVLNLGDGADRLYEVNASVTADGLKFGAGIAVGDITFSTDQGGNLAAWHANGLDMMTIQNWSFGDAYRLDYFEFADGTQISAAQASAAASSSLIGSAFNDTLNGNDLSGSINGLAGNDVLNGNGGNDTLVGGRGNDTLAGGVGNDTLRFSLGDGADIARGTGVAEISDVLRFTADISSADISFSRVGKNLVMSHTNGTDSVTVENWFAITPYGFQSVVFEADGSSKTYAQITDTINNINQPYTFNLGDGAKVIADWGGVDSLTFGAGISKADIVKSRSGVDLVLRHTNNVDQVTLVDWFNDVDTQIETFSFSATGESFTRAELTDPFLTLTGTAGDDVFTGGDAYNETFTGLAGNDQISGGAGDDTITGGLGNDTLAGGAGSDKYYFQAGDGADRITEVGGGANIIQFGPNLVDKLVSTLSGGVLYSFTGTTDSVLYLPNGTAQTLLKFELNGTNGADTLAGSSFGDIIRGLGGNDAIDGNHGEDEIFAGDGNDTVLGGIGVDYLYGEAGDDVLDGNPIYEKYTTHFYGGTGNDQLYGDLDADYYYFSLGDGQDLIIDEPVFISPTWYYSLGDRVIFGAGITPENLTTTQSGGDLTINISASDKITVRNHVSDSKYQLEGLVFANGFSLWGSEVAEIANTKKGTAANNNLSGTTANDPLYGLAGNDSLSGLAGNDLLDGGTGNDTLNGGAGNDRYNFGIGFGQDRIIDSAGNDRVVFASGITASQIVISRSANSLVLGIAGTTDTLTIDNYLSDSNARVETFSFSDLSVLPSASALVSSLAGIYGTVGNDVMQGTSGFDVLYGYAGNDVINALGDIDTAYGDTGNDTIDGGVGGDTLYGDDGNDTLLAGTGDAGAATVTNTLYGGNGNDVLVSSGKTDTLYGESGNDLSLGAAGVDTIQETSGGNMLFGAAGADVLRMGDGNDLSIGGTGGETIDGDFDANGLRGRDILAFNKSDGIDTTSRLGANSTISIGGGTIYSNLSFAISGNDLRLKTGSSHYITLTNWYGGEKNVSTLQIVIEGTSNYNAGSTNPLNNQKIQTFDFLALVAAWDAAGRPNNFSIANNLAAHRIGGSDTAAIGGAIAYQYARTGNLGTLTYAQMQAVINDTAFGVNTQSITPVAALAVLDAPVAVDTASTDLAAASLRTTADTTELATAVVDESNDAVAESGNPSLPEQTTGVAGDHSALNNTPMLDGIVLPVAALERSPVLAELLVAPTPKIAPELFAPAGASGGTGLRVSHTATGAGSNAPAQPARSNRSQAPSTGDGSSAPVKATANDPAQNDKPGVEGRKVDKAAQDESDALVAQWFERSSKNDDLTQLDDILRGDEAVSSASPSTIAAEWERSHQWLSRYAQLRNGAGDTGADSADVSGLSYLGLDDSGFDMPRAVVGLHGVAGHELRTFKGLQEGVKVLGAV